MPGRYEWIGFRDVRQAVLAVGQVKAEFRMADVAEYLECQGVEVFRGRLPWNYKRRFKSISGSEISAALGTLCSYHHEIERIERGLYRLAECAPPRVAPAARLSSHE